MLQLPHHGSLQKKGLEQPEELTLRLLHSTDGYGAHYEEDVLEHFLWWLLNDAPCLEALSLRQDTSLYYSLAVAGLDRLKHLEMQNIRYQDVVCLAKARLPVLETLCINGKDPNDAGADSIDMARYGCLRRLALKTITLPRVIRQSNCQLICNLDILCCDNDSAKWGLVKSMLSSTEQVELFSSTSHYESSPGLARGVCGMFASLPCMQILKVSGEVLSDTSLLATCMPVGGLPMQSLRVFVLHAFTIKCRTPAGFPNLEELVVKAEQELLLDFEDYKTAFSTLRTFYAFGSL